VSSFLTPRAAMNLQKRRKRDHAQGNSHHKDRRTLKEKPKTADPSPKTQEEDEDAKHSRIRHALDSLPGVIKETCKVYREMRADQLDHMKGRSLVWVLSILRAALETQALERLEQRLEELAPSIESKNSGYPTAARQTSRTH
jgi:hypothetical protein